MTSRFLLIFLLSISYKSYSNEISSKVLINSCQEYIAIYDRKNDKKFLAAITTSVAEAMRAGICRGMLEEHAYHDSYNCNNNWYQQASFIANYINIKNLISTERLLDKACES